MAALPTCAKANTVPTNYRWVTCALLFSAMVILYADRQILGLLKPMIDEQFGKMPPAFGIESLRWSNATFGLINSVFLLTYGISMLGFGWLIDKYGTKIGYAICVSAWSFSAASIFLVNSVSLFFVSRIAVGGSEGGCFPCSVKSVAIWFPKGERALATSIFNSGTNVGALLAPVIVPVIALHYGWHACYLAVGVAGVVWIALWWAFYQTPDKSNHANDAEREYISSNVEPGQNTQRVPWSRLLRCRQAWSFIIAKSITDPVWWFFLIWLPDYFKNSSFQLDIKKSWPHLMTIYAIVTILSIVGGWVTGHLSRQPGWTITRARKTGMLIFALLVLPIMAVKYGTPWVAVGLIGLAGAAHQAWSANLFTTVSDMFPQHAIASVTGMGGLAGSISSAAFPYITGLVLDHYKAGNDISGGYAVLFAFCGSVYLIAFLINHLLAPRFEAIKQL